MVDILGGNGEGQEQADGNGIEVNEDVEEDYYYHGQDTAIVGVAEHGFVDTPVHLAHLPLLLLDDLWILRPGIINDLLLILFGYQLLLVLLDKTLEPVEVLLVFDAPEEVLALLHPLDSPLLHEYGIV